MEEDQNDAVPCSSLAVESMLRVGTAGAIWGLCTGPYDASIQGLKGIPRASFVANSVRVYGTQCGLVAGVFSITRCGVKKYRGRNDWFRDQLALIQKAPFLMVAVMFVGIIVWEFDNWVNGLIGGAVAGATVAARTRSRMQVFGMAGLVSVFCAVAEYSRT